jgi:hypothetical protein
MLHQHSESSVIDRHLHGTRHSSLSRQKRHRRLFCLCNILPTCQQAHITHFSNLILVYDPNEETTSRQRRDELPKVGKSAINPHPNCYHTPGSGPRKLIYQATRVTPHTSKQSRKLTHLTIAGCTSPPVRYVSAVSCASSSIVPSVSRRSQSIEPVSEH